MSPQSRHRATRVALAGLFLAGPLLVGTPTSAARAESGQRVVFAGNGLLGLSCVAQPDTRQVTVAADTTLQVVNRTGYRARLLLDGQTQGEIADDDSTQVVFRRGPVTLSLLPSCVLSDESPTVRVDVAAPTATPGPVPTSPSASPATSAPSSSPTPSQTPSSGAPRTPTGGGTLPNGTGSTPRRPADGGLPDGGAAVPTDRARPRAGLGAAVTNPGMPPGEPATVTPGGGGGALAGSAGQVPPGVVVPSGGVVEVPRSAAAEPVAALEPVTETGPIGLLAIMATISVAGVTAAAIRAIAAQRANRANLA